MGSDEVDEAVVDQCCLSKHTGLAHYILPNRSTNEDWEDSDIEHIHPALVHEEALEQALDDDQPLAEDKHDRVNPRAPAMEEGEEGKLRQKSEGEEKKVHEEGYDGQGQQPADEQRIEIFVAEEVVDASERERSCAEPSAQVAVEPFKGA